MTLSRAQFDRLTDAHVAAASAPCSTALAQAGVSADKVKAVLLVGGCSVAQFATSATATCCRIRVQQCPLTCLYLTFFYDGKLNPTLLLHLVSLLLPIHNSRIPAVQALAARVFKQQPVVSDTSEELVVLGACLAARREAFGTAAAAVAAASSSCSCNSVATQF
eukprot:4442-Heterococcus_DN1.PRE.2